jgi:prepilin-type N-terminal cleavage/methylation domain-containing protein
MMRRFRQILQKQAGMTLIEFIVGLAIMGILGTGVMATTTQLISENSRSRSQMQAVHQVEEAGQWLTPDVQMSKTVTPGGTSGFPLVLEWSDLDGNDYEVTYSISGNQLVRSYKVNDGPVEQKTIVQSLDTDSGLTDCTYDGAVLTITVTAKVGTVKETRTYQIKNRPV